MDNNYLTSEQLTALAVMLSGNVDTGVILMISTLSVVRLADVEVEIGLMEVIEDYLRKHVPAYVEYMKFNNAKYN